VKCVNVRKKQFQNHAVVQKRVSDMLQSLIGPVTGILDKFIEDKDQKRLIRQKPRQARCLRAVGARQWVGAVRLLSYIILSLKI